MITIFIICFVCWMLIAFAPLPEPLPKVTVALVCIIVITLGLLSGFGNLRLR